MSTRTLIAAVLCISIHYVLPQLASAAESPCRGKDILIGEDDTRYYCLSRKVVEDCKAKGSDADLDKCIQAGCVRGAGTKLQKQRLACIDQNTSCLEDKGATASLITGITVCLGGLLTPAPGASCFGAALVGSGVHDYAVNLCKKRFGDCMEPPLDEHKNQVKYCSSKSYEKALSKVQPPKPVPISFTGNWSDRDKQLFNESLRGLKDADLRNWIASKAEKNRFKADNFSPLTADGSVLRFKDGFFTGNTTAATRENLLAFEAGKVFWNSMKDKPVGEGKTLERWFIGYYGGHLTAIGYMHTAKHGNEDLPLNRPGIPGDSIF